MRQAAAGLRRLVQPDVIVTSPLLRARQTAEILADAWGHGRVVESRALADGGDEEFLRLANARGEATVVAVGHMPLLAHTLSWLLTGDPKHASFQFRKGGAALVSFDGPAEAGAGQLVWLMQPSQLREMGN